MPPPPCQSKLPPVALPRVLLFDPWNSASTGHQRADGYKDPAYRAERARKLQKQFGGHVLKGGEKNRRALWGEPEKREHSDLGVWVKRGGKLVDDRSSRIRKGAEGGKMELIDNNKVQIASKAETGVTKGSATSIRKRPRDETPEDDIEGGEEEEEQARRVKEEKEEDDDEEKEWWEELPPSGQVPSQEQPEKQELKQKQKQKQERPKRLESVMSGRKKWKGTIQEEKTTRQTKLDVDADTERLALFKAAESTAEGEQSGKTKAMSSFARDALATADDDALVSELLAVPTSAVGEEDESSAANVPPPTEKNLNLPIFNGLTVFLSGPTLPLISDHALKHLLTSHGARIALHIARRGVNATTHVVVGKQSAAAVGGAANTNTDSGTGAGAGGLLAASKLQREVLHRSACGRGVGLSGKGGVKFVSVEWVLESVRAKRRLAERGFAVRVGCAAGEGRVGTSGR